MGLVHVLCCLSLQRFQRHTRDLSSFCTWLAGQPLKNCIFGTFLAVQWLGLDASTAGGTGLIPGLGTNPSDKKIKKEEELHLFFKVKQSCFIMLCQFLVYRKCETDTLRGPTCRGRATSKAEPQELCKQRREREISLCSLRSSGLNLHSQLDVPCICGIPEQTTNHPRIEAVDFGSNCRLGVCFLHLNCFWFYVYLSLVLRAYYHWQICLLIWLLSSFFF